MRADKYLKVSRLIKRRQVANDACDQGKVFINGKAVKPSGEVNVGDRLEVRLGERAICVEVLSIQEYAPKAEASDLYRVIPCV